MVFVWFSLLVCGILASVAYSHFPSVIDLADTTADVTIYGASSLDKLGWAAAAGDINGDGLLDLIVASCGREPLDGQRKGEVEILWGGGLLVTPGEIDLANEDNGISRIFGKPGDNPFSCELACGDFNDDGYDDILLGEPAGLNPWGDGLTYVIFGASNFPDTLDLATGPPNVSAILGGPWGGSLGFKQCACDMNGDGYEDIVVSAPSTNYDGVGEVYVIHGADNLLPVYDMGQAPPGVTRIIDNNWRQATGKGLACKDIDKDGFEDLVIGSPGGDTENNYAGIITLLYGQETLPDTILLSDDSFRMKYIFPEYSDGQLGYSVAIGDMNNDHKEDIIASAFLGDPLGCFNCGEVYVFWDANQLPDSTWVNSTTASITRILGEGYETWYGLTLLVSDMSDNGFEDLIITSFGNMYDIFSVDKVIVVYGSQTLPDSIFLETDSLVTRIYSESHQDHLGVALTAGDFNMDSVNDLAVGASLADPLGRPSAGKVYLFYGIDSTSGGPNYLFPQLVLKQNYPNPFSRSTTIEYYLSEPSPVIITIYNVLGKRVARILKPLESTGPHSITWNGLNDKGEPVSSGIYLYRLKAGGLSQALKMIRLR